MSSTINNENTLRKIESAQSGNLSSNRVYYKTPLYHENNYFQKLFEENQNTDDKGLDSATDQMKKDFYFNNGND